MAWILTKDERELQPHEQALRTQLLAACPKLHEATTLTREFAQLVRDRRGDDLDAWITLASAQGGSAELRGVARG